MREQSFSSESIVTQMDADGEEKSLRIPWERYTLRRAAGQVWLLDTAQAGHPYHRPLQLTGTAGEICRLMKEGRTQEEIAESFAEAYDEPVEEMLEDVRDFLEDLRGRL